jgi:NAD(P)-dependent dehydrogenase (short-subunit alcohol dehydrogenase family)
MEASMSAKGKTVLVTGGTSGIGEATAKAFAKDGANVVITGRDQERGARVVAELRDAGAADARFVRGDLSQVEDVKRLADEVEHIDVLVNNAGIYPVAPTHETDLRVFDDTYAVNVRAPFALASAYAPRMAAQGGGVIVNITTSAASVGVPGMAMYGSTKAALNLLTKAWAAEYGPEGVRVNAVSPGPIRTPGTEPMGESLDQIGASLPLGRVGQAEEIAAAVRFIGSDEASFVNGAVFEVDGGLTAV